MRREMVVKTGSSPRVIFEKCDIDFIENEAYMWSQKKIAEHFKIDERTLTKCIKRQPEFRLAYDRALKKRKEVYGESLVEKKNFISDNAGYKKYVFNDKDIEFIETDGAYLTQKELADYFKISPKTLADIIKRQPEVYTIYQKAKTKKKLQYHKLADDKITGVKTHGDTALLIFQLKTRCRMAEVLPDSTPEYEVIETPEQRKERIEDIKLFTEWKKERQKNKSK